MKTVRESSGYNYWVLKIRGEQKYVGSGRGSGKPYAKVILGKRTRYLSVETATRSADYLRQFDEDEFVIVRVNCKCKVRASPKKAKKTEQSYTPEQSYAERWRPYDPQPRQPPVDMSKRQCPRCGPMRDCDQGTSSICHICGPMNYCMCNEQEMRPGCGM